jgi:CDP-diacylglycerol---glycerol-3-phosphate 3-phosphatidyltransferase
MNWTIPNLLSVFRVIAAPCVAFAFLIFERPQADLIAVILFIAAAATDYLDGWLARILRQESAFGQMLDPIADKAMVTIALAMVITLYDMEWPIVIPAVLIMLREVLVAGLREFLGDVKLQVTPLAKWKTTLQMIAIGLLLLRGALVPGEAARPVIANLVSNAAIAAAAIGLVLLWIAAWFTIVTGYDYFRKGIPHMKDREGRAAKPTAESED